MRIVFMGTPEFSVPTLEALIKGGHQVVAAVTQPDKPKGRGKEMQFPAVKEAALQYGIPVLQPKRAREETFIEELRSYQADVIVVIAFGQILPKAILDMPKYGCINIHASLLPRLRGSAPIQWAIINGEEKTGITTMYMDVGIDTGDMLLKEEYIISPDETGGSLHDRLAHMGGDLILETLKQLEQGTLVREKQNDEESTYVKMLDKAIGKINFDESAKTIERLIRGLNPWPSAYTTIEGKTLKIWKAEVISDLNEAKNGEIIDIGKDYFDVKTGDGILRVKELQLEGKKRMSVDAFLRGYSLIKGIMLGV